jgi:hypothetical protein
MPRFHKNTHDCVVHDWCKTANNLHEEVLGLANAVADTHSFQLQVPAPHRQPCCLHNPILENIRLTVWKLHAIQ